MISRSATINTAAATIVNGNVTGAGAIYRGSGVDGPAAFFLFGSQSAFDGLAGLNASFGIGNANTFPAGKVAVFKFGRLTIQREPRLNLDRGPVDLALLGVDGLQLTTEWELDEDLHSLFLGTQNGALDLGQGSIEGESDLAFLQLYSRAPGATVTLGELKLSDSALLVNSNGGVNALDEVTVKTGAIAASGNITLNDRVEADQLNLQAGGSVRFNKAPKIELLNITSASLAFADDLRVDGGTLTIGAGGINALKGGDLTGFDLIRSQGDVIGGDLSAGTRIEIGGALLNAASGNSQARTLSAPSIAIAGGIRYQGGEATLTILANSVLFDAAGINGANLDGGAGGDGGVLNVGNAAKPITGGIVVNAPISASTGTSGGSLGKTSGTGGGVAMVANGAINVNSRIKVSDSATGKASNAGGNITLESRKTTGNAIAVNNSGELLALLDSVATGKGGAITFKSSGGDITVNGGKVQADRGTVQLQNNGQNGVINLTNATLSGSVVKAGAMGSNGQLIINGGTITADSAIKLYANGSNGSVLFNGNVSLNGNSVKTIAGNTVTIANGVNVNVGGGTAANVFTNNPNYTGSGGNGSTSGKFTGSGATTKPFSNRPGF